MTTRSRSGGQPATVTNFLLPLLLLLLVMSLPVELRAAPLVTARYARIAGQEVVAEISVGHPPPPTIIVIQRLPAEVSVIQAEPATKSANSNRGEVKWLLRGVRAGRIPVRLTLDRPVTSREISGKIRYREPGRGMVTMPITGP